MFDKLFSNFLEKVIQEMNKIENQDKIKKTIVEPIIYYIIEKLSPYVIVFSIFFLLMFIIAVSILFLMIYSKK